VFYDSQVIPGIFILANRGNQEWYFSFIQVKLLYLHWYAHAMLALASVFFGGCGNWRNKKSWWI
jgi:hypothetical protein